MSLILRISLLLGIVLYIIVILTFLKKKKINLRYSLLWFLSALVLLIMDIFPGVVSGVARLLGIEVSVNAVFLIFIFLMMLLLISLTSIVSTQHEQIKTLIQEIAILKSELEHKKSE